jgi:hypothetical protein
MEYEDYDDLIEGLKNLPVTWYPAICVNILLIIIEKQIFKDLSGLTKFIDKTIKKDKKKDK